MKMQRLENGKLGIKGTRDEISNALGSSVQPRENPTDAGQDINNSNPKDVKDNLHAS